MEEYDVGKQNCFCIPQFGFGKEINNLVVGEYMEGNFGRGEI